MSVKHRTGKERTDSEYPRFNAVGRPRIVTVEDIETMAGVEHQAGDDDTTTLHAVGRVHGVKHTSDGIQGCQDAASVLYASPDGERVVERWYTHRSPSEWTGIPHTVSTRPEATDEAGDHSAAIIDAGLQAHQHAGTIEEDE